MVRFSSAAGLHLIGVYLFVTHVSSSPGFFLLSLGTIESVEDFGRPENEDS